MRLPGGVLMSRTLYHGLLAAALLSTSLLTQADPRDLEYLPRFTRAEVVDYRLEEGIERFYPQSAPRRIGGRLRVDAEQAVTGALSLRTYELPSGHGSGEAFAQARQHLQQQGARVLHWCEGRECGSSSVWANTVFGNARLYGPDDGQAYLLLQRAAPHDDTLLALYAITRGNRRAYLHVEALTSTTPLPALMPSAPSVLRALREEGHLSLADWPEKPEEAWVNLLGQALRLDTGLRLRLSGTAADAWREALLAQGVQAARLHSDASRGNGLQLEWLR